jgi:hypothetical protein
LGTPLDRRILRIGYDLHDVILGEVRCMARLVLLGLHHFDDVFAALVVDSVLDWQDFAV